MRTSATNRAVLGGLLLSAALRVIALYAQERERPPAVKLTAEGIAGKTIFQQRCGFCHGADASGGSAPDLLHSTLVLHDERGNLIGPVIHEGRVDKGMPSFDLPDVQVQQIAEFLHTQIKAAASIFYTNSTADYSLERLLVGDAAAGKAYFNGPGKCSQCHSPTGDFAHIATRYQPIDLQTRIAYPRGAVPVVTVKLANGGTVIGKQVYADRYMISLRDADGWVRTFDRSRADVTVSDPLAEHKAQLARYTDKDLHDLFAYLESLK